MVALDRAALEAVCLSQGGFHAPELNSALRLDGLGVTLLTSELEAYTDLRFLSLVGNALETLQGLPWMPALTSLDLSHNEITSLRGLLGGGDTASEVCCSCSGGGSWGNEGCGGEAEAARDPFAEGRGDGGGGGESERVGSEGGDREARGSPPPVAAAVGASSSSVIRPSRFPRAVSQLPNLRHLSLRGNRLASLATLASACPRLESIDVVDNRIADVAELTELARLPNLFRLELQGNPISRREARRKTIETLSVACPRLTSLGLSDGGGEAVADLRGCGACAGTVPSGAARAPRDAADRATNVASPGDEPSQRSSSHLAPEVELAGPPLKPPTRIEVLVALPDLRALDGVRLTSLERKIADIRREGGEEPEERTRREHEAGKAARRRASIAFVLSRVGVTRRGGGEGVGAGVEERPRREAELGGRARPAHPRGPGEIDHRPTGSQGDATGAATTDADLERVRALPWSADGDAVAEGWGEGRGAGTTTTTAGDGGGRAAGEPGGRIDSPGAVRQGGLPAAPASPKVRDRAGAAASPTSTPTRLTVPARWVPAFKMPPTPGAGTDHVPYTIPSRCMGTVGQLTLPAIR